MSMDRRTYDRRIIVKNRRYLQKAENGEPVWTWSPYDAWWDEENGGRFVGIIAEKVGGKIRRFNPISGEVDKMTIERTEKNLKDLLEVYQEARDSDMGEAPMIAIPAETAEAIKSAVFTLEGLRIMYGVYREDAAE